MRKIITHTNPDTDAIMSVWLVKRFLPGWEEATITFVTSGEAEKLTKENSPGTIITDTGRGKFDHHQLDKVVTSASQIIWDYIKKERKHQPLPALETSALEKMVAIETEIDNASDLAWPEVKEDRYEFYFHVLVDGLRKTGMTDEKVMVLGFSLLDALLVNIKNKIKAKKELENGKEFPTPCGRGIGVVAGNKSVLWLGETLGYSVVIQKDPKSGAVRIHSRWDRGVDLTKAYQKIKELDPQSDWYLHSNKLLLLNQASVNPHMKPTKLTLEELIEVLKKS